MNPKLLFCLALVLSVNCCAGIIYPKAPDGGKRIIYKYLEADSKPHNFLYLLGASRIDDLTIGRPFAAYVYDGKHKRASY